MHDYYLKLSELNNTKIEILLPTRGQILDRKGRPVAVNNLGYALSLDPKLGHKKQQKELDQIIQEIIKFFPSFNAKQLKENYLKGYSPYNHNYIKVVPFIAYEDMYVAYAYLLQNDKIKIEHSSNRYYPNNSLASHIIGYIGSYDGVDDLNAKYTAVIGKTGLEKSYNEFLQGRVGYKKVRVDVLNHAIEVLEEKPVPPRMDMTLSIDIDLQKYIDEVFGELSGVVLVMDANNGEILAGGSYPEYNLNVFIEGMSGAEWKELTEDPNNPLLNKMTNGIYPPGSIVKMGVGLSFLEYGGINESTVIETPPFVEYGGRKFRDWTPLGHESADLIKAIRRSVDVYFYKLSQKVGIENIAETLSTMGFGKKTSVDLDNELSGILPTPEWKLANKGEPWFIGDTITSSIGQGLFLVTPMQVARYTALLASKKLVTPHFAIKLGSEVLEFETKDVLSSFQKNKIPSLNLGMYQVCNSFDGTAYGVTRGSKKELACKTGTAQVIGIPQEVKVRALEKEMEYFHRSHAWITAFLPYKNPKYTITILVEHGGSAGKATGHILVSIANKLVELGYI